MTRLWFTLSIAAVLAAFAFSAAAYPWLPARVPIHWNIHGQVDGYGGKAFATLLTPAIMTGLWLLLAALPWLSPQQFKLDTFRPTYWFIAFAVLAMLAYIHGLVLFAALRGGIDVTRAMLAGILLLFGALGIVLTNVKRNFWVGVRTPWTLASERVWNDTHQVAAWLFVAAAATGLVMDVLPLPLPAVTLTVIGLILVAAIAPVLYSLIHYKQLERRGQL
jgi:uncharacterized membrane protein